MAKPTTVIIAESQEEREARERFVGLISRVNTLRIEATGSSSAIPATRSSTSSEVALSLGMLELKAYKNGIIFQALIDLVLGTRGESLHENSERDLGKTTGGQGR